MISTVILKNKPSIIATSTVAGPKEGESRLGKHIDKIFYDDTMGEKTYEKAECKMLTFVIKNVMENARLKESDVGAILSGDLLNQIISSSFAARKFDVPYIGVYNACSTMAEAYALGAALVDGGYLNNVIAATGSHFSTAERQYRYPLELGAIRPPQSQWTVTGAGAGIISSKRGNYPEITSVTFGRVIDFGVTDANNMGAAMAPAAADTIVRHFMESGRDSDYYDLVITGDLGALGSRIVKKICFEKCVDIDRNHVDCGELIYNIDEEEFQGGSGAGCSAVVFNSYIYKKMLKKEIKRVLFVATGALLSTLSTQQGESIPAVAHAISVEAEG